MKGCKPFIFHRIHRLCRWGGAIFRSIVQKKHFRSLAMQDEFLHPAWIVSKTSFFDTLAPGTGGVYVSRRRLRELEQAHKAARARLPGGNFVKN